MGALQVELTMTGDWDRENEATPRGWGGWTAPALLCVAGIYGCPGASSIKLVVTEQCLHRVLFQSSVSVVQIRQ